MTVVWSWVDLGDHCFQNYNVKQYWLLLSVLSVQKFNPKWKRVFVCDEITSNFIKDKGWWKLWDDIKVVDFKNTEYGDLNKINIYSWPKLYAYGLFDDDILMLDIDIVFIKRFIIPNRNIICGKSYNHYDDFKVNNFKCNLGDKWENTEDVQKYLNTKIDIPRIYQNSSCLQGSPIYCPKHLTKPLQEYLISNVLRIEGCFDPPQVTPNLTFYALEEEFPLAYFAKLNGGFCEINIEQYKHGYIYLNKHNLSCGYRTPEKILGIKVYEKYIKMHE